MPSRAWLTISLCCLAAIAEGFDIQSMGVAAPGMAPALHLTRDQLGPAFSASTVGLLVGAIVIGALAVRRDRRANGVRACRVAPQLLVAWLPVTALIAMLVVTAHREARAYDVLVVTARMALGAAILSLPVLWLTRRVAWPNGLTPSFLSLHVVAAIVYAVAFVAINALIDRAAHPRAHVVLHTPGVAAYAVLGGWVYMITAGVTYAATAASRAASAESTAARLQLAALRSQLNPHFLFNALHSVMHLIPTDPGQAARAVEELSDLLRMTLEESRDTTSIAEELAFVRRYLDLEHLRFGDRLRVEESVDAEALDASVPVFSVQTLVENAVRHGAAVSMGQTTIRITAAARNGRVVVTVTDDGTGSPLATSETTGTGLGRLRERLETLFGPDARLLAAREQPAGFRASFTVPIADAR